MSIDELLSMSVPIKEGQVTSDGYSPLSGTGVSFRNVNANGAWDLILPLAKRLNVEVFVQFRWRDKEKAAFPGQEGILHWKP